MSIDFSSLIDLWSYAFFYKAVFVGVLISFLLSWLGAYVVLRREVIFADAISNIAFFGVALAFFFDSSISIFILASCFVAGLIVHYLQSKHILQSDSLLEILAQTGLALAVVIISLLTGYKADLSQFLFGDLLGLSTNDLWITVVLFVALSLVLFLGHRNFVRVSLSNYLSQSVIKNKEFWNLFFVILLAISIGLAIKIVGVLLVAAFTTIPANIAKLLVNTLKRTFVLSVILGVVLTFLGIHLSALLNVPSGATIVLVMVVALIMALAKRSLKFD